MPSSLESLPLVRFAPARTWPETLRQRAHPLPSSGCSLPPRRQPAEAVAGRASAAGHLIFLCHRAQRSSEYLTCVTLNGTTTSELRQTGKRRKLLIRRVLTQFVALRLLAGDVAEGGIHSDSVGSPAYFASCANG